MPVTDPLTIALMAMFAVRCCFWGVDLWRQWLVPCTAPRARAATIQVALGVGPIGFDLVWFVAALTAPRHLLGVVLVLLTMNLFISRSDLRSLRQAWRESSWPDKMQRLRSRMRAALTAPAPAAAGAG